MPEPLGVVEPWHFALVAAVLLALALLAAVARPDAVVSRPRTVLALLGLAAAGAAAVLVRVDPPGLRLSIDPSTEPLLPSGDPGIAVYRQAVRDFGDDQVYVIAMECEDVFQADNLAALRRVGDAISRLHGVRTVRSLMRVTSFRFVPQENWIEVQPFIEEVPHDPAQLAALRKRALSNPLYRRNLVSDDGRTAALDVTFRRMTDREFIASDLDGAILAILRAETRDGRHFYVSGRPHVKSRMYHIMTRDLAVLIPLALCVSAGVLALVAGSLRGVVLPLATVGMAVLWTFASIALLGRPLTVLTVLLAPTLLAIGSVYGVHVVNRYEEEAALGGDVREVALRCARSMTVPVLVSGLTTMVGYAALLITDVPAVYEIGAFSVLGIASVTLVSLTLIPAALALLPPRPDGRAARWRAAEAVGRPLDAALGGLARLASRHSGAVIAAWLALGGAALLVIPRIEIDTDYLSFFDANDPVRQQFDAINRLLAGVVPLYVVLDGRGPGSFRDPELLRRVEALQARIDAVPGVSRTFSAVDTLKLLNRAVERGDPAQARVPDSRQAVTELFFMFPKAELTRVATVDQSEANVVVRTGEVGSAAVRALAARIEGLLGDDALPPGVRARVTGNALLLDRAADGVARSQPRTMLLASLAIFVLLAVTLRSLRLGALAMIPNAIPVLVFFGVLGAGLAPLSLPTSLIGSVALGIAIDGTAHYAVRYRAERLLGASRDEAVAHTTLAVGRAVAIASAMLILGFLAVCFSEFATLRQFGWLSALTMAVCGLADLTLTPALLVRSRL